MGKVKYASALLRFYWRLIAALLILPALPAVLAGHNAPPRLAPETSANLRLLAEQKAVKAASTAAPPHTSNCEHHACLALTFDDGPNPNSTAIILDALEKEQVNATFFLIGRYIKGNEGLVRRMSEDGDDVGNHSWAHPDFTTLSPAQIHQQISDTQTAITDLGLPAPKLFRPPYGAFHPALLKYINMPVILWNIDPKDWMQTSAKDVAKLVEQQAKPGGIIVLHDHIITAQAVERLIEKLKTKYKFVTVTELLDLSAKSRGIYIGL